MPSWLFHFVQLANRLWITVALYSALGLGAALAAAQFDHLVPSDFPLKLGSDSVDDILSILATSLLAVATFSLTTLVTAYTSVISNAAPRAARLLVSDGAVRSSLATFVGAFIYSIVGIIALHTGYYGSQGRVILFFVTVGVVVLVILAMLRWIGQLSSLGQVADVVDRVADSTRNALDSTPIQLARIRSREEDRPPSLSINADTVGFIRNIDVAGLERVAADAGLQVRVEQLPGAFVHPGAPLLSVNGPPPDTRCIAALRGQVSLGRHRTFEQDPGYGFTVLGEIASKALSPGVSDLGTARDVIARTATVLEEWVREREDPPEPGRISIVSFDLGRFLLAALEPVARQAADNAILQSELQAALLALTWLRDDELTEAARRVSLLARDHARDTLKRSEDVTEATAAAARVLGRGAH